MANAQVIRNWTNSLVPSSSGSYRDVRYMVFKAGERLYQEIRDSDENLIHTHELPEGIAMETGSYEVLLRYALAEAASC